MPLKLLKNKLGVALQRKEEHLNSNHRDTFISLSILHYNSHLAFIITGIEKWAAYFSCLLFLGWAHNWHFDESPFSTTIMLQTAQNGGDFEHTLPIRGGRGGGKNNRKVNKSKLFICI